MVPSCAAGAPRWAGWHVRLLLAAAAALPRLSASVCLRPPFERLRGPSKSAYGRAWARWTRAGPDRRSWPVGLGARGMSDAAASPRMTSLCPAGGRREAACRRMQISGRSLCEDSTWRPNVCPRPGLHDRYALFGLSADVRYQWAGRERDIRPGRLCPAQREYRCRGPQLLVGIGIGISDRGCPPLRTDRSTNCVVDRFYPERSHRRERRPRVGGRQFRCAERRVERPSWRGNVGQRHRGPSGSGICCQFAGR